MSTDLLSPISMPAWLLIILIFGLCVALLWAVLPLMQRKLPARWPFENADANVALTLVMVIGGLLFVGAIGAGFAVLWHTTIHALDGSTEGISLGAGSLVAALLGAPFLIWGTILRHRTTRLQQEGHMTDRINKAVEMLGAEKTVDRIGRPVTIWTGKTKSITHLVPKRDKFVLPARSIIDREYSDITDLEIKNEVFDGLHMSVTSWPSERTVIQWQGEELQKEDAEHFGSIGDWAVFSETVPNLEVRIGAILSLERIAQDSTKFDKGRDHVRVMEILCAYIRENAPATELIPTEPPFQRASARVDIQTALDVIKRRSDEQVLIEAQARYRLDLRKTNFDGCNLRKGKFAGALFWQSRFEAADLAMSDLSGAQLQGSLLNFTEFWKAKLRGTNLDRCVFNKPDPGVFNVGFLGGDVEGVSVVAADLSSLTHLGTDPKKVFGSKDTILRGDAEDARHELSELKTKLRAAKKAEATSEISRLEKEIEENPVSHWFEFASQDLALNHFRSEFFKKLGITGWPVEDR